MHCRLNAVALLWLTTVALLWLTTVAAVLIFNTFWQLPDDIADSVSRVHQFHSTAD